MTNYLFGLGTGLFLYWAGGLFLKFAIKALKERKENETKKAEENLVMIVKKIIEADKGK